MSDKSSQGTSKGAATAAYALDGRKNWQTREPVGSGWHQAFDRLLGRGHIFVAQTFSESGMLFRGMPAGLAVALKRKAFWHGAAENPLCTLESDLDVIFCSEVARDALAVARPWQGEATDAAVLLFAGSMFVHRWRRRTAAMLGFADVGMVFKYPCLAEPLGWNELYGLVVHPHSLDACKSLVGQLPASSRPYLIAPPLTAIHDRQAWMQAIDQLMAKERMSAAISRPAAAYPRCPAVR